MTGETALKVAPGLRPGAQDFKDAMAHVATPVSVVTTLSEDGRPLGATVSAFTSLSAEPPLVMVALARDSHTLAAVRRHGRFGINVLGEEQAATALAFAGKDGASKFDEVPWTLRADVPRLSRTAVWLSCWLDELVEGGDHLILVGRVDQVETSREVGPLTYHQRSFGTHRAQALDLGADRSRGE